MMFLDYRLWIDVEAFSRHIDDLPVEERVATQLRDALSSYVAIRYRGDRSQFHVDTLLAASRVSSHPVGTFGKMLLLNLASSDARVREQAWQLYHNAKAKLRSLIISYSYYAHGEFGLALVRGALTDRAASVRLAAAQCDIGLPSDEIQAIEAAEKSEAVKKALHEILRHRHWERYLSPEPGALKSRSFNRADDGCGSECFTVTCVFEHRWLQLSLTFRKPPGGVNGPDAVPSAAQRLCSVSYQVSEPMTRGVAGLLEPRKVVRTVLLAIRDENATLGTQLELEKLWFCQADFGYDDYGEAARLVVRRIATGGDFTTWTSTVFVPPDIKVVQHDSYVTEQFDLGESDT